jgi:hypothetical protein
LQLQSERRPADTWRRRGVFDHGFVPSQGRSTREQEHNRNFEETRMWSHQKVWRGLALIGVALFFGVQALGLHVGTMDRAGPGLFPLMVSGAVGLIGLVMLVQARFEQAEPARFNPKNIAIILVSLTGFVFIAEHLNVLLAIVYLVFASGLAGTGYSVSRNLKISIALIAIAAGFRYLLGLNLPLL